MSDRSVVALRKGFVVAGLAVVAGGLDARSAAASPRARVVADRVAAGAPSTGSVCSGAFVLAAAGLLDGRTVATHWAAAGRLAAFRPGICQTGNALPTSISPPRTCRTSGPSPVGNTLPIVVSKKTGNALPVVRRADIPVQCH